MITIRNWEKYIREMIEISDVTKVNVYSDIQSEITKAYCFEFIDDFGRYELLSFLNLTKDRQEIDKKMYHEQRMYEIHEHQKKLREQHEISQLLKKADDDYNKKYISALSSKRGRPRKT